MKTWIISTCAALLILSGTTACGKQEVVTQQSEKNVTELFTTSEPIVVHYGDGHTIQLDDRLMEELIIKKLKAMPYTKVSGPAEVGQNFTLEFSSDKTYYSTGYFVIAKKVYKVTDKELVSELSKYVIDVGRNSIPELLPGV
ncbi:hypothetical protein A8709_27440 [Paenibacillus pectinilyticus]|uniref:Lipoprotein n=1 Tax=Paenibacillus pectinilyticus TaxID=512399 RepID=A0A1C1A9I2_9BACL|nr:hypothetical protein [Paenibacillus pectinilyticus]OCT17264.1 hypothetical protein A8709_27440 [Paenibacillus pectinilyticus]